MGTSKSKDSTYYDPTLSATLIDETKQCKFYRNQRGDQYQKYKIKHKGNYDFENRYDYRIRNVSPYLVEAYSAKASHNAFGCASGEEYEVVTERIPVRLCDLNNMSGYEALNMAHKSLKGFQQIFKSQGALLIKDTMIGVNKNNDVKVWMNSNFAVNEIQQQPISYGVLTDQEKESTMVDNIVQLINSRAAREPEWTEFVDEKYRNGRIGFDQAIWLCQNIAAAHKISLTDNFHNPQHIQSTIGNQTHQQQPLVHTAVSSNNRQMVSSFPSDHSALKNTNQTVASSTVVTNPMTILANHAKFTNEILPSPTVQQSKVGNIVPAPSSISAMKNRVISGGTLTRKNQVIPGPILPIAASSSMHMEPVVNSSFKVSSIPPPPSTQPLLLPKTNIQPPLQSQLQSQLQPQIITNNSRPNLLVQNRNIRQQTSAVKARPVSQGKPVITFGNKQINASSSTSFSQFTAIRPSPATPTFSSISAANTQLHSNTNFNIPKPQANKPILVPSSNIPAFSLAANVVNQSSTVTATKPAISQNKQGDKIPTMPSTQIIPAVVSGGITAIPFNININANTNTNVSPIFSPISSPNNTSPNLNPNLNQNGNTKSNSQLIQQQQAVAQYTSNFIQPNAVTVASGQQMVLNQIGNIVASNNTPNNNNSNINNSSQQQNNSNRQETPAQQNPQVKLEPVIVSIVEREQAQQQDYLWSVFKQSQADPTINTPSNNNNNSNNNNIGMLSQVQQQQPNTTSIVSNAQVNRTIANYDTQNKASTYNDDDHYEQDTHHQDYKNNSNNNNNQYVHDTPQFGRLQSNEKAKRELFNQYANEHVEVSHAGVYRALSDDLLLAHEQEQLDLLKKDANDNNKNVQVRSNANTNNNSNNNNDNDNNSPNINSGSQLNQRINTEIVKQVQLQRQQKQETTAPQNNNNNPDNTNTFVINKETKVKANEQNNNYFSSDRQIFNVVGAALKANGNTNQNINTNATVNQSANGNNVVSRVATATATVTVKDQKNFKKAVEENASSIRMESSKITIRNSGDLKGLISYKDLRDLLQSVRKIPN